MARKLRAGVMSGVGSLAADPTAPIQIAAKSKQPLVTIQDRLEHGNLIINEVCILANRSKTGFYQDLKAGLVKIEKNGRKSNVRGPLLNGISPGHKRWPLKTKPRLAGRGFSISIPWLEAILRR